MIKNLFITPDGDARGKWLDAFPDAHVVSGDDLSVAGDAELVWLDCDNLTGKDLQKWLQAGIVPSQKVVVMSNAPTEAEAYSVVQAGAYGYCHAFAAPNQLAEIAMVIEHGGIWVGPGVLQRILKAAVNHVNPEGRPAPMALLEQLSKRESMVAQHVARGESNREIAESLNITERTVKAHISIIFEKLGVRDRVQLALKLNKVEI